MKKRMLHIISVFMILIFLFILTQNVVRAEDDSVVISGKVGEVTEEEVISFPLWKKFWLKEYLMQSPETTIEYTEGVRVYVILSDEQDILDTKCVITDENGEYSIKVPKGSYSIETDKTGYENSKLWDIDATSSTTVEADIALIEGNHEDSRFFPLSINENRNLINEKINDDKIGGEITVNSSSDTLYKKTFVVYSDIVFKPINMTKGNLTFDVNGEDDVGGRTIVINIEDDFFNLEDGTTILYDEKEIYLADDLTDILNPDDDGSNPEYIIISGENGLQMFLSIPHFSEHSISIFNTPVEELSDIDIPDIIDPEEIVEEVKQNKELVAILSIGILIIATFIMLRKGKD